MYETEFRNFTVSFFRWRKASARQFNDMGEVPDPNWAHVGTTVQSILIVCVALVSWGGKMICVDLLRQLNYKVRTIRRRYPFFNLFITMNLQVSIADMVSRNHGANSCILWKRTGFNNRSLSSPRPSARSICQVKVSTIESDTQIRSLYPLYIHC